MLLSGHRSFMMSTSQRMTDSKMCIRDSDKFEGAFESRDIYNMRARNYILSRLENFENKAPIIIENYTIEHIMPQNKNLSLEWQADLGTCLLYTSRCV